MKKGKWNYTEDIYFKVVNLRIGPVADKPLYWQNAHIALFGDNIQAVLIQPGKGPAFLISNQDGLGLLKIAHGGGPDMSSAHIDANFEILEDVPEYEWNDWDPHADFLRGQAIEEWQEKNFPEEFKKIQALKQAWANSPMAAMARKRLRG